MTTRYEVRVEVRTLQRQAEQLMAGWRELVRASRRVTALAAQRRAQLATARRRQAEDIRRIGG